MKFKLTRYLPTKIEIEVLPNQVISMFPIEAQHHPVFGNIKRVWLSDGVQYSVDGFCDEEKEFLNSGKHIKLKDNVMFKLLQDMESFQIVLFYSDKQDIYDVRRL